MSAELDAFHQLELMGKLQAGEAYRPSLASAGDYSSRLQQARKALNLPDADPAPAGKRKALSDTEKLRLAREQAAALVRDRTPYAERLPLLRARAHFLSLTLRDAELERMLRDERSRAAGALEPVKPGQRLDLSPTPWLWEGLVMPGRLNLVVALPKLGKTSLMLGWIAAWHHGCQTFLDRPLVGPCPAVLVVGTDQPENDWGAMLQRAGLMDASAELSAPFLALFHKGAPLHLDPEGIERIARYAEDQPGLVILLDSIAACIGPLGIDENSRELAEPIRDLMEAVAPYRATLVAIHHSNKGRAGESATVASRGSTALPAEASQIISLSRMPTPEGQPDSPQVILRTEGRGGRPQRLLIEQTDQGWICHGQGETIEERQRLQRAARDLNSRQRAALQVICQRWRDGCQATEAKALAEAIGLDGDGERKARSVLEQLEKNGLSTNRLEAGEGARRKLYAPTLEGLQAVDLLPAPLSAYANGSEGSEGSEAPGDRGAPTLRTHQAHEVEGYESPERLADTSRERRLRANPAAAEQADADRMWEQQHARRTAAEPDPFSTPASGEAAHLLQPGDPVEVWSAPLKQWQGGWAVSGPPDAEGRFPLRDDRGRRQHVSPRNLRPATGGQQEVA